ncbi:hypothetical protein TSOC_015357, partial [Tetrabaena socialis]
AALAMCLRVARVFLKIPLPARRPAAYPRIAYPSPATEQQLSPSPVFHTSGSSAV